MELIIVSLKSNINIISYCLGFEYLYALPVNVDYLRDHEDDEIILHHYYLMAEISPANLPGSDIEMIIEFAETAKAIF